ncbi:response regulator transcription factor [Francisella sciaenopsi]|uniref:Response regulator n=1 Tax=Francisella sciaenopsi TaxID=3055034 RepID=A0ABQ6PHI0_9GAMM
MKYKILIVDDDLEISKLLQDFLTKFEYEVHHAKEHNSMKQLLKDFIFDIILLDIMLPQVDGYELCRYIRSNYTTPIIMISALDQDTDRILGLEMGADDYLTKPFNTRELLARIKAVLRRSQDSTKSTIKNNNGRLIKIDNIHLDKHNQCILKDNVSIVLSKKEYNLLLIFLEHPNQILSRNQLIDQLYDNKSFDPFDRTIDVLIGRLRKKLEINNNNILETIRGTGYKLNIDRSNLK